jgi:hypothetical protein
LILKANPADALAIAGHEDQAESFGFVQVRMFFKPLFHTIVLQPLGAADRYFPSIHLRFDSASRSLREIIGLH